MILFPERGDSCVEGVWQHQSWASPRCDDRESALQLSSLHCGPVQACTGWFEEKVCMAAGGLIVQAVRLYANN